MSIVESFIHLLLKTKNPSNPQICVSCQLPCPTANPQIHGQKHNILFSPFSTIHKHLQKEEKEL